MGMLHALLCTLCHVFYMLHASYVSWRPASCILACSMLNSEPCMLHASLCTRRSMLGYMQDERASADLDGLVDPVDEPGEEPGVEGAAQPVPPLTRLTRTHLRTRHIYTVRKG
jgi:hypothetical protein